MELNERVSEIPGIGPFFSKKFEKLGIKTLENLFYYVPSRYLDYSLITTVNKLEAGSTATIHAKVVSITNIFSKRGVRMQIGSVEDETGKIAVVWFNQPFLIRTLYPGRLVSLSGKVGFFNKKLCITSPDYEILDSADKETTHTGRLVPIYPETEGLSSKWMRTKIKNIFQGITIRDFIDKKPDLETAIKFVHFPKTLEEARIGRERLAFNELLFLNLKNELRKSKWRKNKSVKSLVIDKTKIDKFIKSLPFKLTDSQNNAVSEILSDLKRGYPMNRLLEGDVGSGKTVVAAIAAFAVHENGGKTIVMAPTQILATQHYKTLTSLFGKTAKIELITSETKNIESADLFVGTHALLHKELNFDKVALVVIDEQHRFGVEQRSLLIKKSKTPHVLTMTATPIPRTVAMVSFGDLELSTLKEMPKDRQKVTTWVVPERKREGAYAWIEKQVNINKSQAFIVCPLVEDSEKETMKDIKSVTSEFAKLRSIFKDLKLGLLHGRLKSSEKEKILNDFRAGKLDILVATPVVEVGIDIPNATIMVIEEAERFGLAQLHQLRGRVGRGVKKSYCLLFGSPTRRLKAMTKMNSGFELAELDLKIRGPGEIFGTAQSGFDELKIASYSNYEMIKETKDLAKQIIGSPSKYKELIVKCSSVSAL